MKHRRHPHIVLNIKYDDSLPYLTYLTTNKLSGQFYIGRSQQYRLAKGYMGSGPLIQAALAKFGADAFEIQILNTFETLEESKADEARLVNAAVLADPLTYNQCGGGGGAGEGKLHPMFGAKRPDTVARNRATRGPAHPSHGTTCPAQSMRMRAIKGEKHPSYGIKGEHHPLHGIPNPAHSRRMSGAANHQFGVTHSPQRTARRLESKRLNKIAAEFLGMPASVIKSLKLIEQGKICYYSVYTGIVKMIAPNAVVPAGYILGRPDKATKRLLRQAA